MNRRDSNELTDGTGKTLRVTVGEGDRHNREALKRIRAAERGEDLEDAQPILNFDSFSALTHFFRESNLELLETIVREGPASISETARLVDRDYREVHRNLSELEDLGLVEFEGAGEGKPRKPIVPYDGIDLSISFTEDAEEFDPVTT